MLLPQGRVRHNLGAKTTRKKKKITNPRTHDQQHTCQKMSSEEEINKDNQDMS